MIKLIQLWNFIDFSARKFLTELLLARLKWASQESKSSLPKLVPVYDVVNAGPRHRFCTTNLLVHNCLGAGYGCGAEKFITVAKTMADLEIDLETATKIVGDFRRSNPKITQFWRTLEMAMKREARGNFSIELPSGRSMTYYDVKLAGGLTAVLGLGGKRYKFWGGVLTENVCQAVARDVIRDAIINLEAAGITTLFTVHDEVICEVPVDFDSNIIRRIMVQEPSWMPGIPLDVSLEESAFYKK